MKLCLKLIRVMSYISIRTFWCARLLVCHQPLCIAVINHQRSILTQSDFLHSPLPGNCTSCNVEFSRILKKRVSLFLNSSSFTILCCFFINISFSCLTPNLSLMDTPSRVIFVLLDRFSLFLLSISV